MPPGGHARLSPSAARRWTNCTGSVTLIESLRDRERATFEVTADNEYIAFGVRAHGLAEFWLQTGVVGDVDVEQEVIDCVRPYVEYVQARAVELAVTPAIEKKVDLTSLHPPESIYGTPDAQLIAPDVLEIVDLKTGQGVRVDPVGNEQLVTYAAGALERYGARPPAEVWLTIVQPRAGGISTWKTTPTEVLVLAQSYIAAAWDVGTDRATLKPGDWCRFCPAQAHCPALKAHAQIVTQMDFDAVPVDTPPSPDLIPLEDAAALLSKVKVLDNWFNALRLRVQRELEAGRPVPGWKLVTKRPRRVWNNIEELQLWAERQDLGESELFNRELKSPAQVELVVGKKNLPGELYTAVSSGLTMVPESDARPAVAVGPTEDFVALPPAILEAILAEETE